MKLPLSSLDHYFSSLPTLSHLIVGKELYMYLLTSWHAVSVALTRVRNVFHAPIYYVSRVLMELESRYSSFERVNTKYD